MEELLERQASQQRRREVLCERLHSPPAPSDAGPENAWRARVGKDAEPAHREREGFVAGGHGLCRLGHGLWILDVPQEAQRQVNRLRLLRAEPLHAGRYPVQFAAQRIRQGNGPEHSQATAVKRRSSR